MTRFKVVDPYTHKRNIPDDYKNIAEIAVLKNKNGPTGVAPFLFDGPRFRFIDLEQGAKARYKGYIGGNDAESFTEGVG